MKVIVNADDLGMSRSVNDAIFELMAKGHITSATVLANAEALDDASARRHTAPHCSFGVHLNASQWRPLTRQASLAPILDESGCFAGNRLRKIKVNNRLRAALLEEWSAQVERVRASGFAISHFDSHHHMHTVPTIFPVLKQLQRRFGIRKVRASMNLYAADRPASRKLLAAKWLWNKALACYVTTTMTQGFTSLAIFHREAKVRQLAFSTIELMVHPGGAGFEDETALLATEWWGELPLRIELVNYSQI